MATKSLTVKIDGDTYQLQQSLKGVTKSTEKLQTDLSAIALKATAAFAGLSATVTGLISTYRVQEQAEKKLETTLRSTGYAAGLTSDELKKMASELQSVSTFGDEAIIESQALLLTFTKIGKDVFPKATESILNMSAAMGTDLKLNTIMLGKALNDPIAGVNALTRAGVQLSDQQKEQIKTFTETGRVAKAQAIILKELQVQFGGQARATAEGTGRFKQLSNTLGDVGEKIGKHLVPPLSKFAETLNGVLNTLLKDGDEFGKMAARSLVFATNLAGLTAGFALFTKGIIAARVAVSGLSLSFKGLLRVLARSGIGAILVGIGLALDQLLFNFENFVPKVKKIWRIVSSYIKSQTKIIKKEFKTTTFVLGLLKDMLVKLPGELVKTWKGVGKMLKNFFIKPTKKAAAEYPDLIQRMIAKGNEKMLEGGAEFTEQLKENTKTALEGIREVINDDRVVRTEAEKAEDERKRQAREEKELAEEAYRLKGHKREMKLRLNEKKHIIDHEKFIMAVHKRELAHQLKSEAAEDKRKAKRRKQEFDNTKSSLATISTLMSSSNKTLFGIGKAAAIASAMVEAPAAIIKAWNTPWPLNLVLAPLVAVAVGAQIAQIASAQPPAMRDGGIITGGVSGIDSVNARLMPGELVVPTRNFEEVVGAVGGARDSDIFGGENQIGVVIGFDGDEAGQVLTAQQIENQALGISIEEAS